MEDIVIPESIYQSEDINCTIDTDFEDALKREELIDIPSPKTPVLKSIILKAFDEKGKQIPFALEDTDIVISVVE